jgi:20S proteasome alpha/beta subunit
LTVCVAAFAAKSQAIVMISDKAITLGDMVSDTSICKVSRIGDFPWYAMIAGDIGTADEILTRVTLALEKKREIADADYSMMGTVSRIYADVYQEHLIAEVLTPKLLTKEAAFYREKPLLRLNEKLEDEITTDRQGFENRWGCEILVCGFDAKGRPQMFYVVQPDRAVGRSRQGYAAIGSGAAESEGRLMWRESDRDDKLERVLWEAFDAKVQAELMLGVGYGWDASIILKSQPCDSIEVPMHIQKLMDKAITMVNHSPFDEDPLEPDEMPRDDWKEQLQEFTNSLIPNELTFC